MSIAATRDTPSLAEDWSGTLDASLATSYVRNPQLIAGSHESDETGQVAVDGNAVMQTELAQLTVTPRLLSTRYLHETQLDVDTGSLSFALEKKQERGQWTLGGQALVDSTVTSELGTTGLTDVNQKHYMNTLSLSDVYLATERLSWQLQGAWQDTRYTNAQQYGLTNYEYLSGQFGPAWSFSQTLHGSLNLGADRITPDVGVRQEAYSIDAELRHDFTEKYGWHASAGASRIEAGNSGAQNTSVFEVGATRKGEVVNWDLAVKRAVVPIGLGFLAPSETAALGVVANLSEHSTLSVSFNAIHTEAVSYLQYVVYQGASWGQVSGEWRRQLTPHWTVAATCTQARGRSGTPQEWANSSQVRLSIFWQSLRL